MCIQEFTEERTIAEALFFGKCMKCRGVFRIASYIEHQRDGIVGKWRCWSTLDFVLGRGIPAMGAIDAVDIVCTGDLDIFTCLDKIDAIVVSGNIRFGRELELGANNIEDAFGNRFVGACDKEIIDLAEEQDKVSIEGSAIDTFVVSSGGETKFI